MLDRDRAPLYCLQYKGITMLVRRYYEGFLCTFPREAVSLEETSTGGAGRWGETDNSSVSVAVLMAKNGLLQFCATCDGYS